MSKRKYHLIVEADLEYEAGGPDELDLLDRLDKMNSAPAYRGMALARRHLLTNATDVTAQVIYKGVKC